MYLEITANNITILILPWLIGVKKKIGTEDASAPITMWGNFSINQEANTELKGNTTPIINAGY